MHLSHMSGYSDIGLLLTGAIVGYFFTDLVKSAKYMLKLPPILILFGIASGIYLYGKAGPTRLPADVITEFAIGLTLRGRHLS